MGNKIPMEGVTETKFRAEMEGRTIQRLTHPGIHPINSHQTQTLLHMPARFCWKDPDIGPWYSCLLWGYASAWQTQKWVLTVIYWLEHRAPNGGARESPQRAEGVCNPIGGTSIWTNHIAHVSSCGALGYAHTGWSPVKLRWWTRDPVVIIYLHETEGIPSCWNYGPCLSYHPPQSHKRSMARSQVNNVPSFWPSG